MTIFDYETLTKLGARLFDHADSITNPAAHEMEVDIRSAARVCSNFATLRFRIGEIAEMALTQDLAATRRDPARRRRPGRPAVVHPGCGLLLDPAAVLLLLAASSARR